MEKIKLEDVAAYAGVSPTTVSRVINNRGAISDKTRQKVAQAMDDLNYYPNEIARSLFVKRTNSIGLLFPDLMNPFFGEMATKLEILFAEMNFKVFICDTNNNLEKETAYLRMLLANQVDGIIVGSHNKPSKIYQQANLPIVSIDRYVSESVPIVRSNNFQGGQLATDYLVKKDCQKIALLSGSKPDEVENGEQRARGYANVIRAHHLEEIYYFVDFDEPVYQQQLKVKQFLQDFPDVDGVFATGDSLAALLNKESKKSKRTIEIVGYDGTEFFTNYFGNFATIKQPIEAMVHKAVELLLEFLDEDFQHAGKEFMFDTELIVP